MRPGVFPAGKATACNVCNQQIQPGDLILRIAGRMMLPTKEAGLVYMPGAYADEGCVWHGSLVSAPYLSWEQMDMVMAVVQEIKLPKGEHRTRKLLGAIRVMQFNKHHHKGWKPADPALALGEDLLAGYRFILTLAEREGPWFEPVGHDGQPWRGVYVAPPMPERPAGAEEETERTRRVKTFDVHPMVDTIETKDLAEDGYWVRGSIVTPVKFCLLTPINVHIRPMDKPGRENWIIVPNYQLAGTLQEAQADVEEWLARGRAAGH